MGVCAKVFIFFLIFISLLLFSSTFSFAQEKGVLIGKVIDAESGKPVSGATVELQGTLFKTTTDAEGSYQFKEVPPGKYTVVVKELGYTTAKLVDQEVLSKEKHFVQLLYDAQGGEKERRCLHDWRNNGDRRKADNSGRA